MERDLEKAKIDVVETCGDFNLFDAFRILDRDTKGYLSAFDIRDAFNNRDGLDLPHLSMEDIELFIARYDKNADRRIRFAEFSAAFTPVDPFYRDSLAGRKGKEYPLAPKTMLMYRNLWITQIKIE